MSKKELAFIPAFLFLILYLILSVYNCFSHDDLQYLKSVQAVGVVKSTVLNYLGWNTRWASVWLANSFFCIIQQSQWLVIFHVLTLVLIWLSAFFLLGSINKTFGLKIEFANRLTYSLLFIFLLWFNTFSVGDVWFWLNASCMYLWNVIALFFAIALILNVSTSITKTVVVSVCGIYIGGSSEPFVVFTLCAIVLLYFIFKKHHIIFSAHMVLVFVVGVAAGFLISYVGEGNSIRYQALPQTSFIQRNFIFIKSLAKFWLIYMPLKIVGSLVIAVPFVFMGMQCKASATAVKIKKQLLLFVALLLVFSVINFYSIAMIMSEAGPERAWTSMSVLITFCLAYLFFDAGRARVFSHPSFSVFYTSSIVVVSSVLVLLALNQRQVLKKYAQSYHMRTLILKNLKNKNLSGTVYLPPLSQPGLLRSAEISTNPTYYTNLELKNFYDLSFDIAIQKQSQTTKP